ncbi:MAG: hypothetical protein U9O20_01180 [Patescibacteria group bacterium]|nr:hypothetical protein [Patescibacteria group bacterium]
MIKYVLQSGGLQKNSQKVALFFNETVKGLGPKPKVLLCFFAEKRGNWEDKVQQYSERSMALLKGNVQPSFELALPADEFEEQGKMSDVV